MRTATYFLFIHSVAKRDEKVKKTIVERIYLQADFSLLWLFRCGRCHVDFTQGFVQCLPFSERKRDFSGLSFLKFLFDADGQFNAA